MRATEYFLTPADLWRVLRDARFERRDLLGAIIFIVIGFVGRMFFNLGLEDNLFLGILFASLWWRLDPRYPLIGAIGVLILIPILQLLQNVLWLGDTSEPLAVIAYYLLVIGVLGQVRVLRSEKGSEEPEEPRERQPVEEPVTEPKPRKPVRPARMRSPETIEKLRANREALRRRDW